MHYLKFRMSAALAAACVTIALAAVAQAGSPQSAEDAAAFRLKMGGDTSSANRLDKSFTITHSLGLSWFGLHQDIAVAMHLDPDLQLELEGGAFGDLPGVMASGYPKKRGGMALTGRARWFMHNSFFIASGLRWRRYTQRDMHLFSVVHDPTYTKFGIDDLALSFSLGNRWQFKHINIGVTWLSFSVPLVVLGSETMIFETATERIIKVTDSRQDAGVIGDLRLMSLDIGVAF